MLHKFLSLFGLLVVLAVYSQAQDFLDALFVSDAPVAPTSPPVYTCSGECVPYYLCDGNQIVTDGTGIIDIRVGEDTTVENECPNYMEKCCEKEEVLPEAPPAATAPRRPTGKYTCGARNPEGLGFRITGNRNGESEYGEFPWMLAILREDNAYECGGSLITPNVVLTAAHCIMNKPKKKFLVRAGEWDTQTKNELHPHQNRRVREVITHNQFHQGSLANDVGLLILEQPFDLAENIQPVCLPPKNFNFDGSSCFASGWGRNIFGKGGKYQVILKKVQLSFVPHYQCQSAMRTTRLGERFRLHQSFICAGGEKGADTCRGDGGSPLVCQIPGASTNYYQAGIVAWGIGCGEQGIPGVYANVAMFRDWIDQQLTQRNVESKHYTFT
ncbi:phenoloxidase-activating factor 2-like [Wyeomyia smithii]|uniref:phenoloxidase-activating factor 2-like n=1 Tax=Wyeomyia smithii TaxID=174621 RepID=UPI002467D307|nr:phenoloxidase-activating factor 2-like [Wyeomyia smithii]XP_055528974.1 phenoloxidase-activating factor 2-like [Wyeomyia smithii]XP_055528977.1 phenoloxidase-activating factor 2-like [Wyeomyia smithii]XP_055528978.1 phenoloxidase-activating factor 2-like [Wyeomyia smithii]